MGGMLITFLGGMLVLTGWKNAFFAFLYALPILLICLFCIPKDEKVSKGEDTKAKEEKRIKLNKEVLILCMMIFFIGLTFGVINTNSALLVVERNLGEPALANFATSAMTATGIVVGLLYGSIAKVFKRFMLPVAFALFAVGMFLMGSASSVFIFFIGKIITGAGMSSIMPTGLSRVAQSVDLNSSTFAISMFLSSNMVAVFLSPIIMNPVSHAVASGTAQSRYIIGFIIVAVLSLLALLYVNKGKPPAA